MLSDKISRLEEVIAKIFPECMTESRGADGKLKRAVNFRVLKEILSGEVSDEPEAYDFTWVGKNAARAEAYRRIDKTLRPSVDESVDWDTTKNLYIEGDNLDVLKLLQHSYMGKVKMIYIDPPYNTGHDFIYRDRFEMDEEEYAEGTLQFDDEGDKNFVENGESNPRFHSDWCSMIYARLLLARNLLTDDGVIFISIDDNEQANLKKICDEIFGAANFVAQFVWKRRSGANDALKNVSLDHEYVFCYSRSPDVTLKGTVKTFENYSNPDDDPRGPWIRDNLTCGKTASQRPNLFYPITDPKTGTVFECNPDHVWRFEKKTMNRLIDEGKVLFPSDGVGRPAYKRFRAEIRSDNKPFSSIIDTQLNSAATRELRNIFDAQVFNYPKTVDLIEQLIRQGTDADSVVLDFFSGSATTAHAVMQLNAEDGGNRRFIMIQLPEPCAPDSEAAKADFKTICDIGKERIRRAGDRIKSKAPLTTENLDVGFRVLKLDTTNFRDVYRTAAELTQDMLADFEENIKGDRTALDLLFGCLLDWGVELNLPCKSEEYDGATIHDYADGALLACFDKNIGESVIEYMAKKKPLRAVFRDAGFTSDAARLNAEEVFKLYAPNTDVKVI